MEIEYEIAVGIVFNKKGDILLGRAISTDDRNGLLTFPGGEIEEDEDIVTSVIRIVKEETNIQTSSADPIIFTHLSMPEVAFVKLQAINEEIITNDEFAEMKFYSVKDLDTSQVMNSNLDLLKCLGIKFDNPVYVKDNSISESEVSTIELISREDLFQISRELDLRGVEYSESPGKRLHFNPAKSGIVMDVLSYLDIDYNEIVTEGKSIKYTIKKFVESNKSVEEFFNLK